jgi:flagellar protein FlgJ
MNIAALPAMPASPLIIDPTLLATQARSSDDKALDAVANGFDGIFASLMVKQLRESSGSENLFGNENGEILGGLFDFYMGQHLAQSGMLGIGAMVKKQLEARGIGNERNVSSQGVGPNGAGQDVPSLTQSGGTTAASQPGSSAAVPLNAGRNGAGSAGEGSRDLQGSGEQHPPGARTTRPVLPAGG